MRLNKTSLFDIINTFFMVLVIFVTLYPFMFMLASSFSDPLYVMQNKIFLLPKGFTLFNYKMVFEDREVWPAYWNTIKYVLIGTFISVSMTIATAYPLSKKRFMGRNFLMLFFAFTMVFSGGVVPTYIVVQKIGLVNTMWAVVLVPAINTWRLIITRTFLQSLPDSMEESAYIDGANDIQILVKIIIPLSLPIISTIALFYAVSLWNAYFTPLIYLNDKRKYPLQIYLTQLLVKGVMAEDASKKGTESTGGILVSTSIKYTVIIVSTLPILAIYPFVQKYFVKGVMIGAIKG